MDVDSPRLIELHRAILEAKPLTRRVFAEIYGACLAAEARHLSGEGLRIEIGAGSSFFKSLSPDLITTDVKPFPGHDMTVDALAMPFAPGAVKTVFGIHTFHHLPDPGAFFRELTRVLLPGGGCVLVEPYYGPVASLLYERLFTTESFDKAGPWTTDVGGPMAGANQALSYLVFVRDQRNFALRYPGLRLVEMRPLTNWLRYLLSGGVNFRALAPVRADPALQAVERLLAPASRTLALHHLIVLRRSQGTP